MIRRWTAVAAVLAASIVMGASPSGADPRNSFQIPATCEGVDFTFNVFSSGHASPGLDADSNVVFMPTMVDLTFEENGQSWTESWSKQGGMRGRTIATCTVDVSGDGFTIQGVVHGVFAPSMP